MKHIKPYKPIYYFPIEYDECQKLLGICGIRLGKNKEDLTIKDIDTLTNILNGYSEIKFEFNKKIMAGNRHLEISNGEDFWYIDKVSDEWFLAIHHKRSLLFAERYKCDQLEGLIKLIRDKILK